MSVVSSPEVRRPHIRNPSPPQKREGRWRWILIERGQSEYQVRERSKFRGEFIVKKSLRVGSGKT